MFSVKNNKTMNCIIVDDDKLQKRIVEEYIKKTDSLNLIGSFDSAIDAIPILNSNLEIHLIFLDIEMPEMNGIEFLDSLQHLPQIVIMSSKDKYALDAFEYDVTDYLLKPISYARFYKAVDKVYNKLNKQKNNDGIFIKNSSNTLVRLNYNDILWVEALENYVVVNNYKDKYTILFTMKAMEKKLPANTFTRVHRSYIVNVKKINVIEDNSIIMKTSTGTKMIPIAKSYKEKLMSYINIAIK